MDTSLHIQGISVTDPVPYQPTRAYTEFIQVEVDDDDDSALPSKVKYSFFLQEEEYEEEEEDFFRDK
jgi:hypothetical protein